VINCPSDYVSVINCRVINCRVIKCHQTRHILHVGLYASTTHWRILPTLMQSK